MNMKLIVGIGNPGKVYEKTRHNIGFMVIDAYLGNISYQEKFNALYTKKIIDGETVYFLKPLTYVNNSGEAVAAFMKYFDIDIKDILVIHDDLDKVAFFSADSSKFERKFVEQIIIPSCCSI